MNSERPNENIGADAATTGKPGNERPAKPDWLKSHAKSFAVRWAVVSAVLWITWLSNGGKFLAAFPLTLPAVVSSCAAIGFYVAHRARNK